MVIGHANIHMKRFCSLSGYACVRDGLSASILNNYTKKLAENESVSQSIE